MLKLSNVLRVLLLISTEFSFLRFFCVMPSRAVIRKKIRRESKKREKVDPQTSLASTPCLQSLNEICAPMRFDDDCSVKDDCSRTGMNASFSTFSSSSVVLRKRKRDETEVESSPSSTLSRKEKRRLQLESRLHKEISRMDARKKREETNNKEFGAKSCDTAINCCSTEFDPLQASSTGDTCSSSVNNVSLSRHDPRFVNGTFWRDRKERRARTVFLGGLPVKNFTPAHVEKLITSTLRGDPAAQSYLENLGANASPLSNVEYLSLKSGGKVRHMYVTLASVPLAGCLCTSLDGKEFNGRLLRCNFAADKAQRAEAIRRRGREC